MFTRKAKLRDPVTLSLDGRDVRAERGEPIAMALLAHGERVLSRSPKLHRPRSATCFRGDCDGCIARVDGSPNIMTCRRAASGGEVVIAQNVLGSRKLDLLRLTDWFFPNGIDHHHLLAGVPGASDLMQTFARQMAGIGRLPDAAAPPRAASALSIDLLIVGGGLAGLTLASKASALGIDLRLVDESPELGFFARAVPSIAPRVRDHATSLQDRHLHATALGVFEDSVLLAALTSKGAEAGAVLVRPRAVAFATGAHDGGLLVSGNDLPGVTSARAGALLASRGIVPDGPAVVVGGGVWTEALKEHLGAKALVELAENDVAGLDGTTEVEAVRTKAGKRIEACVVFIDTTPGPSFELAAQAGAQTRRGPAGFDVVTDDEGVVVREDGATTTPTLFATGECIGLPFEPERLASHADRTAQSIARALLG